MRARTRTVILIAWLGGCDDGGGDDGEPPPSFAEIRDRVLEPSCSFQACHSGASPAGMLGLDGGTAHANLLADSPMVGRARVVPGDADGSYLMEKLTAETPAVGDPMPPTAPLEAERIELVRAWIDDGAAAE